MVQVVKPRTLGLLTKAERRRSGASFVISALGMFDLADPTDFEGEQALWLAAAKALPPGAILDMAMPKPTAEVLIAGHARAASGDPTTLMQVAARIGAWETRLAVVGDRVWQAGRGGYTPTPPRPFLEMPLAPARAFGGAGHPLNPVGAGYRALPRLFAGELVSLPNIEIPGRMVHAIEDEPPPALFGAIELDSPQRRKFAGTYDRRWVETVAPALPDDVDPRLFMHGHRQNWLDGYLAGDEALGLLGFDDAQPSIAGRLPGMRVRAFITMAGNRDALVEIPMVIDTLWLFAGARRGILVYRGAQPVEDIEARDVADVVLAYERLGDPPRSIAEYAAFRRLRCDPETAQRVALSEGPLVPAKPEGAVRRRDEARRIAAEAEAARQHAAQVFLFERQMREAGVPEVLWPEVPPPQPPDFLLPTPEEIAAGDLDLGEILDAVEAMRRQAEAELEKAQATRAELDLDLASLGRPGAVASDVDRLLDRLAAMGAEIPVAQLDAQLRDAALVASPEASDPAAVDRVAAAMAKAQDWRQLMLDAARPPARSAAREADAAFARMMRLPEGSPFADIRSGLAELAGIELPSIPDELDLTGSLPAAEKTATPLDLQAMLDDLAAGSSELADVRASSAAQLAGMGEKLAAALPGLRGPDPLAALVESLAAAAPAIAPVPPDEAAQRARAAFTKSREQSAASLDAAERRLEEGMPQIRRRSPTALYPEEPLSPAAARMFGERVLEAVRDGLVLAGRDLAGIDLLGADLSGADLRGCLMEGAVLTGARLAGAALAGVALTGATLDEADLTGSDLSGANLAHVRARRARFSGCTLEAARLDEIVLDGAALDRARLRDGSLVKASLVGVDLSGALIEAMVFIESDLSGSDLTNATIASTQFLASNVSRVRADGAVLRETCFINTPATGAGLRGARMDRCSFLGEIDLSGACLDAIEATDTTWNGGNLGAARFRRARLKRTMFAGADLTGADFRLASATGVLLDNCRLVRADFTAADLRGAQMHRADATAASFRGANLYGCDLSDTVLAGSDLAGCNLAKTVIAMVGTHVD
jgi:uncharacterized protein YjbI with pentapeptide repeats